MATNTTRKLTAPSDLTKPYFTPVKNLLVFQPVITATVEISLVNWGVVSLRFSANWSEQRKSPERRYR